MPIYRGPEHQPTTLQSLSDTVQKMAEAAGEATAQWFMNYHCTVWLADPWVTPALAVDAWNITMEQLARVAGRAGELCHRQ
jgi:hypothetical protein